MGQLFAHDFKLDSVSDGLKQSILHEINDELPDNHHQILVYIAKKIVSIEKTDPDFYKQDLDESDDFATISNGAAIYAAEYLLEKDFVVDNDYKQIVDLIIHDSEPSDDEKIPDVPAGNLIGKFHRIMHIPSDVGDVYGGNEKERVLVLANQIKTISFETYLKLLRVFIVSLANQE